MKTKTVKGHVTLKATPHEVYEMLIDSKKQSMITGSKAVVSKRVGGSFSIYDGDLYGKNLEITPDKKIVQSWRLREWKPEDHFSKVTFLIKELKMGTRLTVIHEDVPAYDSKDIKTSWKEFYFEPMREMLEA